MSEAIIIQNSTLYQVSVEGDVDGLQRLLREDSLVLDKVSAITSFSETPLHIAAMRGHFDLARALLEHRPELADELDSLRRLPLHWASGKGYSDIVKELLQKSTSPDHKACFVRDGDGRIPLHLAAIKGRGDVIKELIRTCPESVTEKVENGGTILHLCVKYNSFEALKLLMDTKEGQELVNDSDDYGNTILHLAVVFKQVEITKYLVSRSIDIDANASNVKGFTALDAAEQSLMDSKALEIKNILLEAGIQKNNTLKAENPPSVPSATSTQRGCWAARKCQKWWRKYMESIGRRLEEARGNILVAATVTASMAYQAGISPPNFKKIAADEQQKIDTTYINAAPVPMAENDNDIPLYGQFFWYNNTLSLMFSLAIIVLMLSGIPFRNKFSNFILVFATGAIVLSITLAYFYATDVPKILDEGYGWHRVDVMIFVCSIAMVPLICCLIILIHVCTFLMHLVFKILKYVKKLICMFNFGWFDTRE